MRTLVWVVSCLAACGGGSSNGKITIDRFDDVSQPTQLAVRDGDGPWKVIPIDATEFAVESDRFLLAAACEYKFDSGTFTWSTMSGRATDESDSITLPCVNDDDTAQTRHQVSIQMQEAGGVRIGDSETAQASGPWTATVGVPSGSHTLTAFDETRLAIRRDVAISGPTTLDPISLATEGKPLVQQPFTLAGATSFVGYSFLYIGDELAWISRPDTGTTVPIPDPSLLVAGDTRSVYLGDGDRYVMLLDYQETAPTSYELLPALTSVTRTGRTVAWTSVPDGDTYLTSIYSETGTTQESLSVSAAWLDGGTELTMDFTEIPNWNPAWVVPTGALTFGVQTRPVENTIISSTIRLP